MKQTGIKKTLKNVIPPGLRSRIRGIRYGWHGNYDSWKEAGAHCTGYDSSEILNTVRKSMEKIRAGEAVYERDSVIFDKIQYSHPLLSSLMWIAALNRGELNIIDFGGSLGTTYFQNRIFLDSLPSVKWCIVEQPLFVQAGKESFSSDKLRFFESIEECRAEYRIDAVLFSSVLQYLEKPYQMINSVLSKNFRFIIIDRTPFISGKDRITVQRVPPSIYRASYPCWFFNEEKFVSFFSPEYKMIMEFPALDSANIKSEFKGFLFAKSILT